MAIYITGDTHADWTRFTTDGFPDQKELTRDDFVIVCGDFGLWNRSKKEDWWFDWFSTRNFTVLFVDGNHEQFDRLYSDEFPVIDFHGGKAHKIRENLYHLIRGHVFELCGKKFFAFGGASSHDIQDGILDPADYDTEDEFKQVYKEWCFDFKRFRVNHVSWWKEELPSREEMDFGIENLEKHNWKVDYVITHCLPQEVCAIIGFRDSDPLTRFFNELIRNGLKFREWHAGHYHFKDRIMGKYYVHYGDIVRII